jgi:hypothetical protein
LKISRPYAYTVKIINREKKSEFTMQKLPSITKFSSIEELKASFHRGLQFIPSEFGFIQPGHGLRGRLRWILDDGDLDEMYSEYPKKHDFNLWCYKQVDEVETPCRSGHTHKRATPTEGAAPAPKAKSTCVRKVSEVEAIIKDLREKHGTNFNVEQFSMWAHVIHIGKHSSREAPPDLPFFRQGSKKKTTTAPSSSTSTPTPSSSAAVSPTPSSSVAVSPTLSSSAAVSPGKRVSLRSECINQLDKWHSLLEKGIITQEQYEDMQKAILKDMYKF